MRALSGAERQIWLLGHCAPFNMALLLEVDAPAEAPAEDALREALDRVQARHPLLRAAVRLTGRGPALVETDRPVPVEVLRGHAVDEALSEALSTRLAVEDGPLVSARLIPAEGGGWALILVFDHTASDGTSALAVLRDLAQALGLTASAALSPRAAAPDEIAPLIELIPREARGLAAWARFLGRRVVESWRRLRRGRAGALARGGVDGPRRTRVIRYWLDAREIQALRALRPELGASVHGLLAAAQLIAARALFPGHEPIPMAVYSPTDLRPRMRAPGPRPATGAEAPRGLRADLLGQYVGFALCEHRVAEGADVRALARAITARLRTLRDTRDDILWQRLNHLVMRLLAPWLPPDDRGARRLASLSAGGVRHTTIVSSMGQAADLVPGVPGARAAVTASNIPWCDLSSVSLAAPGGLSWCFCWTHPALTEDEARAVAERAVAIVRALAGTAAVPEDTRGAA
jgi:hypothetical protein